MLRAITLFAVLVVANAAGSLTNLVVTPETDVTTGTALKATAGLLVTVKVATATAGSGVNINIPGNFTDVKKANVTLVVKAGAAPAKTDTTAVATKLTALADTDVVATASSLSVFIKDNDTTAFANDDFVGIYVTAGTLDATVCTKAVVATMFVEGGTTLSTETSETISKQVTKDVVAACTQCADAVKATDSVAATTGTAITALCFCGNLTTASTEAPKTCASGKVCAATRADPKAEAAGDTFTCTASEEKSNAFTTGVSSFVAFALVALVKLL